MVDFVIGYQADTFGPRLAAELGCEFRPFKNIYYPEGAPVTVISAEYKEIEGKHVVTVRRNEQISDRDRVCRLLLNYPRVGRNLKNIFHAAKVDIIHPYFILGKQDHNPRTDENPRIKRDDKGKDQGYLYEASLFAGACDRLITFHPHFHREPGNFELEGTNIFALDAIPAMERYAKSVGISQNSLVVSPDLSGGNVEDGYIMAKAFADRTGREFRYLESKRQNPSKKSKTHLDAEGRGVVIVDDSAITLSTIEAADESIQNHGEMDVLVAHGVLPEDGYRRANELTRGSGSIRHFCATNTVRSDFSEMSIIDELVEFYKGE